MSASSSCQNPACRRPLSADSRSHANYKFCTECGDLVYAFRPDRDLPDDWYLVSDGSKPEEGSVVSGGQCEDCALNEFRVVQAARVTWDALCAGQIADGSKVLGCGTLHPIRMKMRYQVIVPWSEAQES